MDPSTTTRAVIPAYNCEQTIAPVIRGIQRQGLDVIVVDDGSQDATASNARSAGARVIQHGANRGKGHALVTGFKTALSDGALAVVTLDGDGQHNPDDLPRLLAHSESADLVIGQRQLVIDRMPPASFVGNCISTFFVSLFCGKHFPDTQCGFRLYSKKLLSSIAPVGGRFETETELLMRASKLGLNIRWVPVETIYDNGVTPRTTHFHNFYDSLRVIEVVLRSTRFPTKGS